MLKKIGAIGFLFLTLVYFIFQSLIHYGLRQAKGQFDVIYHSVPLQDVLKDSTIADSTKQKILLIEEIRNFAIDSLGLNNSNNYQSYYDQKGKAILWMLVASPPFEIKAKEWSFPIIGSFPYKGFFDYSTAVNEAKLLAENGLDTSIQEVAAWSTLGWFNDPILSSMLERSEKSLANLIIHELTHSTIFIKGEGEYNESLASFIGEKGADAFLIHKYGHHLNIVEDSIRMTRRNLYQKIMRTVSEELSLLYINTKGLDSIERKLLKDRKILSVENRLDSLFPSWNHPKLNNAHFASFKTYRNQVNPFEKEFEENYQNDLKLFIASLKKKQHSD